MRVAVLMDHPSPHMVGLLDALAETADAAVQVVYLRRSAPERHWGNPAGNLPYRFVATRERRPVLSSFGVAGLMASIRADVWIVNTVYTAPETWAAVAWLNRSGLPWVYMNEPIRPRGRADGLKRAIVRQLLGGAAGVIGMGREAQARFADLLRQAGPSASVPYYLDLEEFLDLPTPAVPTGDAPVRFVMAAQMVRRKGVDVLLDACARLPKQGWLLTLAGDGPLRRELESAAADRFGCERVSFVGQVPYGKRATIFEGQHVFVFPSRWDGWGMAPVEAMAAGLAVISTDQVMSMREFLRDGENGYLIASEDPASLAARMTAFLAAPERIPVMGRAARAALADYRPQTGASRLLGFLSELDRSLQLAVATDSRPAAVQDDEALTWQSLTECRQMSRRLRQQGRALAKRAVIRTRVAFAGRRRVPRGNRILVYHLVLKEDRRRFEEHLAFLQDHYRLVTADQLVRQLGHECEGALAAITFDDGFRVLMQEALEAMEKRGIKATFFVPTDFIACAGEPARAAQFSRRAHYYERPIAPMTVDDLRRLRDCGHEIGSHGVSHLGMNATSRALAASELTESRAQLAAWLGAVPTGFAYPYGHFDSPIGEPAQWTVEAGYNYAVTLRRGPVLAGSDLMRLSRDHVEGRWEVNDLIYFLSR